MRTDGSDRRFIGKRDLALIVAFLAAAVIAAVVIYVFRADKGNAAEIRVDGKVVRTVDLSVDGVFDLEQNPHIHFEIRGGAIAFIESDCPDQICVRTGYIDKPGQSATCLPNRCSVRVIGEGGVDAVAGK